MIRRTLLLFLFLAPVMTSLAQDDKEYTVDLTAPKEVVNAIFYAAQTEDLAVLQGLCDPMQENDSDTERLCTISEVQKQIEEYGGSEKTKKQVKSFKKVFGSGRIRGKVSYHEHEGTKYAEVPILIDHPAGDERSKEKMKLVKRYGNWYLSSF